MLGANETNRAKVEVGMSEREREREREGGDVEKKREKGAIGREIINQC